MSDAVRAGIIGFMGEVHARAVRSCGGTVVAVAGSTPERRRQAVGWPHGAQAADSANDLMKSDDIDVTHICTPNDLHAPLAEQALAGGKHLVCEKPLAVELRCAERMAELAAAADVVSSVPFVYRYYFAVPEARPRVREGLTGPLDLLHGSYMHDWLSSPQQTDWCVDTQRGGASSANIGVHCELVEFVLGHRIVGLQARLMTVHGSRGPEGNDQPEVRNEDAAVVLFETNLGALGSLVSIQASPGRKNRFWFPVDGAESLLSVNQELPEALWVGTQETVQLIPRGSSVTSPAAAPYDVLPPPATRKVSRTASPPASQTSIRRSAEAHRTGCRVSRTGFAPRLSWPISWTSTFSSRSFIFTVVLLSIVPVLVFYFLPRRDLSMALRRAHEDRPPVALGGEHSARFAY